MRIALAAVAAALVPAPAAHAGARVDYDHFFTSSVPGSSTGVDSILLYKNPNDPNAKPIGVRQEVFTFPPGTKWDGSVVPDCMASDSQMQSQGRQACPPDTWMEGGLNDTIMTGFPGAGETPLEVDGFDYDPEGFRLIVGSQQPPLRFVAHAVRKDNVVTVTVPPSPGGPPDGQSVPRRVNNYVPPRTLGSRAFVRTPLTCPATGVWTFTGRFTFADGVVETDTSTTPCTNDTIPPSVRVTRVPRHGCVAHAFAAHVRVDDDSMLSRVRVRLNGRVIQETKLADFTQEIAVAAMRRGRNRLSATAVDASGNQGRQVLHFARCGRRRPGLRRSDA